MATFPRDDELQTMTHFPYPEGENYEFKTSLKFGQLKLYATICAFLNRSGGYMIFGITDDRKIVGCNHTSKEYDIFALEVDAIFHSKEIVKLSETPVRPATVTIKTIVLATTGKYVVVITVTPEEGETYAVKDGTVFVRANVSNAVLSGAKSKHYAKWELDQMVAQQETIAKNYYDEKLGILLQQLAAKDKIIKENQVIAKQYFNELTTNKIIVGQYFNTIEKQKLNNMDISQKLSEIQEILFAKILREKDECEKKMREPKSYCVELYDWFLSC